MIRFLLGVTLGAVLSAVLQYQIDELDNDLVRASGNLIREDEQWLRATTESL